MTLRLQRTGRKKLAHYRLIAQEHSLSPTSGRVVEFLGTFNPYSKEFTFDKENVEKHLSNGAQPSNKVAKLLQANGQKLPKWVTITTKPERKKEEPPKTAAEESVESEPASDEAAQDENVSSDSDADTPAAEETPAEEPAQQEDESTEAAPTEDAAASEDDTKE